MNPPRRHLMLGTAGHVDHGKSALVKLLTGCETDSLAEEQQRGLTIDLGFAPCRLSDQRVVGIVDVPGHVDFIRNMVAGAQGIDLVLFVVAADDGIMPQTHEHLHILTLMGVRKGVVALTKVDLVEAARRDAIVQDLRQLLAGTFLQDAAICPLSNLTGEGYDAFFETLNREVNACQDRPCGGLFRMWIDDAFTIRGSGTVVSGMPTTGRVHVGDLLHLLPGTGTSSVRRLEVYGAEAGEGRAGECVALNLPDLDQEGIRRGMVLEEKGASALVTQVEVELQALDWLPRSLADRVEVQLHVGTAAVSARVALLEARDIAPGQTQMAQLRWSAPLPLAPGDRFVLRANLPASDRTGLVTVGGGIVLGVDNVRLRRHKPWTITRLRGRRESIGNPLRWMEQMLGESERSIRQTELQSLCRLKPHEAAAQINRFVEEGRVRRTAGGAWVHQDVMRRKADAALAAVRAFHDQHPQQAGMGRDALIALLSVDADLFELVLESLLHSKRLERSGTVYRLSGWGARRSEQDEALCDQVQRLFANAGWTSPTPGEVAEVLQRPLGMIQQAVRWLEQEGVLVRMDPAMVIHRDAIAAARQVVLRLFAQKPAFTTMEFRDALAVSRKYAVPILDHLDRTRLTVRTGHTRTPGAEAKKLL
jgi:selenocysteine-specific elongation factor